MKKTITLFVFSLLLLDSVFAEDKKPFHSELLFIRNHVALVTGPTLFFAEKKAITGNGNFEIKPNPGAFLGLRYRHNFNENFALTTGAHFGLQSLSYCFTKEGRSNKQTLMLPFINLPLTFLGRIKLTPKNFLNAEFGMNVNYYFPGSFSQSERYQNDVSQENYFSVLLRYNENKPVLNFNFGLAYAAVLRNFNMLEVGLRYNLGKRNFIEGEYTFREDNAIVENGKVYSKNDYWALEITYVFTRAWCVLH